jgi:hypothetical protein
MRLHFGEFTFVKGIIFFDGVNINIQKVSSPSKKHMLSRDTYISSQRKLMVLYPEG